MLHELICCVVLEFDVRRSSGACVGFSFHPLKQRVCAGGGWCLLKNDGELCGDVLAPSICSVAWVGLGFLLWLCVINYHPIISGAVASEQPWFICSGALGCCALEICWASLSSGHLESSAEPEFMGQTPRAAVALPWLLPRGIDLTDSNNTRLK